MKKLAFSAAVLLLFAPTAMATIVPVDLTLDPIAPTVNTFTSTLSMDLSYAGLGTASDGDTSTSTGTTKMNLDMTFDPTTHQVTGISNMEFVQELLTGPISQSDVSYQLNFLYAQTLNVAGTDVGGTMYTSQTNDTSPGPSMSTVTGNTSFPGTEQYLGLDQGHFVLSGITVMEYDWDLSDVDGMAFAAQVDPGTVIVSAPTLDGDFAIYTVNVVQPMQSTYIIWNPYFDEEIPENGPEQLGELVTSGNMVMSGEITRSAVLRPGDTNGDGSVDETDAATLAANWLSGPGATWMQGNFNGDGYVNDEDATMMAANWGAPAAAVPEPATAAGLLALALAGLALWRRR